MSSILVVLAKTGLFLEACRQSPIYLPRFHLLIWYGWEAGFCMVGRQAFGLWGGRPMGRMMCTVDLTVMVDLIIIVDLTIMVDLNITNNFFLKTTKMGFPKTTIFSPKLQK